MITLPKPLTTVTTFSKIIALILFIAFPFFGFALGMQYQALLDKAQTPPLLPYTPPPKGVACTMDAKICPDGSAVGRVPPNCEFEECPNSNIRPTGIESGTGVSCPTDAKLCSDGTTVGREGPNCDFQLCPSPDIGDTQTSPSNTCRNEYGGMTEAGCSSVPLEGRACSADSDCTTSCSMGCIKIGWTPKTRMMECMSEPMYSCSCVNHVCKISK